MSVFAWAETLEKKEAERRGVSRREVRPWLASKIGLLPGTLENIINRRIKEPRQRIVDAVRNAFVREMENEIRALEHEIHMALQVGARADDAEIIQAQDHIQMAKRLIGK